MIGLDISMEVSIKAVFIQEFVSLTTQQQTQVSTKQFHLTGVHSLKLHGMRTIVLGKSELSIKVLLGDRGREEGTYFHELDLVDVGKKGSIDSLLIILTDLRNLDGLESGDERGGENSYLGLLVEESLISGLLLDLSGKVGIIDVLRNLNTREIDLGGGGDDVSLVDTSERDTIDLVGT